MRGEKAQFYLIAAVIIIGVLIGLATVTNIVIDKKTSMKEKDLQDEIKLESENVINHGIFTMPPAGMNILLQEFALEYKNYISDDQDVLFVYSDAETIRTGGKVYVVSLFHVQSEISLVIGSGETSLPIDTAELVESEILVGGVTGHTVIIKVGEVNYEFELTEGQNFYFVIRKPMELQGG